MAGAIEPKSKLAHQICDQIQVNMTHVQAEPITETPSTQEEKALVKR